jgi:hypothetical protein
VDSPKPIGVDDRDLLKNVCQALDSLALVEGLDGSCSVCKVDGYDVDVLL